MIARNQNDKLIQQLQPILPQCFQRSIVYQVHHIEHTHAYVDLYLNHLASAQEDRGETK
jgi:hypothetical protein